MFLVVLVVPKPNWAVVPSFLSSKVFGSVFLSCAVLVSVIVVKHRD